MAIKNGIRQLLLAQPGITALCPAQTVNSESVPAVFVETVRQGVKSPHIVISRTGSDARVAMDGTYGMASTEIDIDCFAATATKAEAIAKAVSDVFKDYSGPAGTSDAIDAVLWDSTNDFENSEQNGNDQWRYAVTLGFTVHHHGV